MSWNYLNTFSSSSLMPSLVSSLSSPEQNHTQNVQYFKVHNMVPVRGFTLLTGELILLCTKT